MFSIFLSSYRNTRESLGELEKAVETLACGLCSHIISRSPNIQLMFNWNTVHDFYFLIISLTLSEKPSGRKNGYLVVNKSQWYKKRIEEL